MFKSNLHYLDKYVPYIRINHDLKKNSVDYQIDARNNIIAVRREEIHANMPVLTEGAMDKFVLNSVM